MKIVKVPIAEGSLNMPDDSKLAPDLIVNEFKSIWSSQDFKSFNYIVGEEIKDIDQLLDADGEIFIGGDHLITYNLFRNIKKKFENIGLIIFDAHPDCFQEFKTATHQDWLKFLIDGDILKKENVVLLGIRNADLKEIGFLNQNKIRYYSASNINENLDDVCDFVMEKMKDLDAIYISIDIDAMDPAFAPGTNYLEPAGLTTLQLFHIIKRLKSLRNLKRIDLVEVNPKKDINDITVKLAAKIVLEFTT